MRNILNSEIKKERCNAAALGAYNASVGDSNPDYEKQLQEYKSLDGRYTDQKETERKMELQIILLEKQLKDRKKLSPKSNHSYQESGLTQRKKDLQEYRKEIAGYKTK